MPLANMAVGPSPPEAGPGQALPDGWNLGDVLVVVKTQEAETACFPEDGQHCEKKRGGKERNAVGTQKLWDLS